MLNNDPDNHTPVTVTVTVEYREGAETLHHLPAGATPAQIALACGMPADVIRDLAAKEHGMPWGPTAPVQ
jgi:hypothetical protein